MTALFQAWGLRLGLRLVIGLEPEPELGLGLELAGLGLVRIRFNPALSPPRLSRGLLRVLPRRQL